MTEHMIIIVIASALWLQTAATLPLLIYVHREIELINHRLNDLQDRQ